MMPNLLVTSRGNLAISCDGDAALTDENGADCACPEPQCWRLASRCPCSERGAPNLQVPCAWVDLHGPVVFEHRGACYEVSPGSPSSTVLTHEEVVPTVLYESCEDCCPPNAGCWVQYTPCSCAEAEDAIYVPCDLLDDPPPPIVVYLGECFEQGVIVKALPDGVGETEGFDTTDAQSCAECCDCEACSNDHDDICEDDCPACLSVQVSNLNLSNTPAGVCVPATSFSVQFIRTSGCRWKVQIDTPLPTLTPGCNCPPIVPAATATSGATISCGLSRWRIVLPITLFFLDDGVEPPECLQNGGITLGFESLNAQCNCPHQAGSWTVFQLQGDATFLTIPTVTVTPC